MLTRDGGIPWRLDLGREVASLPAVQYHPAGMAPPPAPEVDHGLAHDPVWQAALNAPPAEDVLSPEERAGLEVADADLRAGHMPTSDGAALLAMVERAARAMARFGAAGENAGIALGEVIRWLDTGEVSSGLAVLLASEQRAHDPVLFAFDNAPLSDEPETDEERAAFEEGMADIRAGRSRQIPPEEMRAILEKVRLAQGGTAGDE